MDDQSVAAHGVKQSTVVPNSGFDFLARTIFEMVTSATPAASSRASATSEADLGSGPRPTMGALYRPGDVEADERQGLRLPRLTPPTPDGRRTTAPPARRRPAWTASTETSVKLARWTGAPARASLRRSSSLYASVT
mmetsp:Transcript_28375/g.91487  ORF Transcript_28375/g.91487 Transcript_28375/m.91487 type:complete len:137 (-) Transcript_28375:164-574(-)